MLSPRLRGELEAKKADLDGLRPWPQACYHTLWSDVAREWAYHSAALEGLPLTGPQAELILRAYPQRGAASPEEQMLLNHREAIEFIHTHVQFHHALDAHTIRQINRQLLAGLQDEEAGRYRREPALKDRPFTPARPAHIRGEIRRLLVWLRGEGLLLHPAERAAAVQCRLITVQPFAQANTPTARLFSNLLLLRQGFPPAIIFKALRRVYLEALAEAYRGNLLPVESVVGEALGHSLDRYVEAIRGWAEEKTDASQ